MPLQIHSLPPFRYLLCICFSFATGTPEISETNPVLTRFAARGKPLSNYTCRTKKVRHVCIFGVIDLPALKFDERVELFLNKIHLTYQPLILDCLEEYYFNRTQAELRYQTSTMYCRQSWSNSVDISGTVQGC